MRYQLPIWWSVWWIGSVLLTLGLILLNVFRRRRVALPVEEAERKALPTLREDLLWSALVLLAGGAGLGIMLWLLSGAHTARSLLVAAVAGLVMLLGLAMLLRNGLAPTDVIHLDEPAQEAEEAPETSPEKEYERQQRLRISGPFG